MNNDVKTALLLVKFRQLGPLIGQGRGDTKDKDIIVRILFTLQELICMRRRDVASPPF